jgi:hypothetical protein
MFIKTLSLCFLFLFIGISSLFAQNTEITNTVVGNGIGIGSALAIAICWTRTNSVLTSIIAGFFGWLYVIYYLIIRNKE